MAFVEQLDQSNRDLFFFENVKNYENSMHVEVYWLKAKPQYSDLRCHMSDITIHLSIISLTEFCSAPYHFITENI